MENRICGGKAVKRLLAFCLGILLLVPGAVSAKAPSQSGETPALDPEVKWLLEETGVFDGSEQPSEAVLRGQFTAYAVRLMGMKPSGGTEPFSDISGHAYGGFIAAAYQLGLVSLPEDGLFRPDDPILYPEAVKLLVSAAGYGYLADSLGGYPAGYLTAASRYGIIRGEHLNGGITLSQAAQMLYDALQTDAVRQTEAGSTSRYEIIKDTPVMTEVFDITLRRGLMDGNQNGGLHSIEEGKTGEGMASVDGRLYRVADGETAEWIGMNIRFYSRRTADDDVETILYAEADEDRNTVWTVQSSEVASAEKTLITYYVQDGRGTRSIRIKPDTSVLYNGRFWTKAFADSVAPEALTSKNGTTVLIDNDQDGQADVIKIDEMVHYLASFSSSENNAVYDKLTGARFCGDEIDQLYVKLMYGPEIQLSEIQENDILAIKMPKPALGEDEIAYAEVYVMNDTITALPEQLKSGGEEIVLEGETYRLSNQYLSLQGKTDYTPQIQTGTKYRFCLGYAGEIEAVLPASAEQSLVFLVGVARTGNELESGVKIKCYNLDSKRLEVLDLAERVTFYEANPNVNFGGETEIDPDKNPSVIATAAKSAEEQEAKLKENGAVRNELIKLVKNNAGAVSKITLATSASHGFNRLTRSGWSLGFTLGSQYVAKPTSKILMVPPDKENERAYSIVDRTKLSNKEYTLDLYQVNAYCQYDYAVLQSKSGGNVDYDAPIFAIEEVNTVLNEDGDMAKQLSGYYDGQEKQLFVPDESLTSVESLTDKSYSAVTAGELRFGDLIQIDEAAGELITFRLIYRYDPEEDGIFLEFCDTTANKAFIPNIDFAFGRSRIKAVSEEVVTIENNGDKTLLMNKYNGFSNVYLYDLERQVIRLGKPADLLPDEYVLTGWRWAWCMDAVVYR